MVVAEAGDRGHVDLARAQSHVAELTFVEHALPQRRDRPCRHGGLLPGLPKPGDPGRRRTSMIYSGDQDTARVAKVILYDPSKMALLSRFLSMLSLVNLCFCSAPRRQR